MPTFRRRKKPVGEISFSSGPNKVIIEGKKVPFSVEGEMNVIVKGPIELVSKDGKPINFKNVRVGKPKKKQ